MDETCALTDEERVRFEAEGTVAVAGTSVAGKVRMQYAVHHDGEVSIRSLVAWMDDLDLTLDFLWWETDVEPLRCTQFRNTEPLTGELDALGEQLESRKLIDRAKGILADECAMKEQDAFTFLQRTAISERGRMRDVAERVIAGTLRP